MANKYLYVLTMKVNVTNLSDVIKQVTGWARLSKSSYVCVSNVHMCMETKDSEQFRQIVNTADLIVADGKPIQIAQKLLGYPEAHQVRGMDLTYALCQVASQSNIKVGFYGGMPDILLEMRDKLIEKYPDLCVTYCFSPPFRVLSPLEQEDIFKNIIDSKTQILFVGLGCPKQERWMAEHRGKLPCVMLGVGAAFDFIAGQKHHAPRWMQRLALEWLFRLISEPKRLWRRYLIQNPRFMFYFFLQYLRFLTEKKG